MMKLLTPAHKPLADAPVRPADSVRKARGLFRGSDLLPLTYSVQDELARAHGSHEAALAMRHRSRMQRAPIDGSGARTERMLVISDLHPSSGTDPETGRFDALDDFGPTQQRQLSAFMSREWLGATREREQPSVRDHVFEKLNGLSSVSIGDSSIDELRRLRDANGSHALPLLLLGDIVDFLQVPRIAPGFTFPDGLASHGRAPRNTPANCLVQMNIIHAGHRELFRTFAMHLFLGHRIDFVPGNHDRALYHPLLWSGELEVNGKRMLGFTKILESELRDMGATEDEIEASIARIQRLPFVIKDDTIFEHGDHNDIYNKVRRPYKELIDPSPIHDEMEMAFGDHGVRDGFNDLERARPTADAIDDSLLFWSKVLQVPRHGARLIYSFFKGATREGYDVSPAEDQRIRESDIAKMVAQDPRLLEMANAMRPDDEKLSRDEFVNGLQAIDRVSARPLFSNFKRGTNFLRRAITVGLRGFIGDVDMRSQESAGRDRWEALHRILGINNVVDGHTHVAKNEHFLTRHEKVIHHVNTHTWMNKSGHWNEDGNHWGDESRGVGILERGVTATGIPWSELSLMRVVDEDGILVAGELIETFEASESSLRGDARALFEGNKRRMAIQEASPYVGDGAKKKLDGPRRVPTVGRRPGKSTQPREPAYTRAVVSRDVSEMVVVRPARSARPTEAAPSTRQQSVQDAPRLVPRKAKAHQNLDVTARDDAPVGKRSRHIDV